MDEQDILGKVVRITTNDEFNGLYGIPVVMYANIKRTTGINLLGDAYTDEKTKYFYGDEYEVVLCEGCQEPFTETEWEDNHPDDDGSPYHDICCPICGHDVEAQEVIADREFILEVVRDLQKQGFDADSIENYFENHSDYSPFQIYYIMEYLVKEVYNES